MRLWLIICAIFFVTPVMAATSPKCPGEEGYFYTNDRHSKNPSDGGFISHDADVTDDIWVGKNAAICGFSSVTKSARILGRSVVCGNAKVHGSRARITGYARVCGNAEVDGTHQEVTMQGYFETNSGVYNKGTYSAEKPAPKVKTKSTKEVVSEFVKALGNFAETYYSFTDGDIRKMGYEEEYSVKIDDANNPCEVVVTKSTETEAKREGYYALEPYEEQTFRIDLGELDIGDVGESEWKKTYRGMLIFTFSVDRIKTDDLYVFSYVKHTDDGDTWYTREYETIDALWINGESKSKLQKLNAKFKAAVEVCGG